MDLQKEIESLNAFFDSHRAINLTSFCREADISTSTMHKLLNGDFVPSAKIINKIKFVAQEYGFRGGIQI